MSMILIPVPIISKWATVCDGQLSGSIIHGQCLGFQTKTNPHSKVYGTTMGPTWVLTTPDGPHIGPMNLAIRETFA